MIWTRADETIAQFLLRSAPRWVVWIGDWAFPCARNGVSNRLQLGEQINQKRTCFENIRLSLSAHFNCHWRSTMFVPHFPLHISNHREHIEMSIEKPRAARNIKKRKKIVLIFEQFKSRLSICLIFFFIFWFSISNCLIGSWIIRSYLYVELNFVHFLHFIGISYTFSVWWEWIHCVYVTARTTTATRRIVIAQILKHLRFHGVTFSACVNLSQSVFRRAYQIGVGIDITSSTNYLFYVIY